MTEYKIGDIISLKGALDQRLLEPGTRVSIDVTSGFYSQRYYGEVKAYRLGRSLVLFDGGWLKWQRPEYLTLENER